MDSGSGSLQSSSGGDEEYDSRAESISAFLNNPSSTHVGPMPNPPQPPPPQQQHHQHHQTQSSSILFDPLSNYFDPLSSRSPPLNLDMVWSKTLRSDPNCTDLTNIMASTAPSSNHPFSQGQNRIGGVSTTFSGNSSPAMQFTPAPENAAARASTASDQPNNTNTVRNSKKRSRASRRAPTTVLTTDTTNFRAMVQEFTGIPAPPFTSSSPFPRTRLDLFATPSSIRSSPHLDISSPPPYLLRPFAQKIHPPPFISSSMADAIVSTTTTNNTNNSTSINLLPSDHLGLLKQQPHQNLLNMQSNSPILTFQSLLQTTPPRYPLPNSAIFGSKSHGSLEIPSNDPNLKMGIVDEFGLNHGHVTTHHFSGLPNMISSDGPASRSTTTHNNNNNNNNNNNRNSPTSWVGGDGGGSNVDGGDHGLLRSLNGNYSTQRVTNGKLNYSASSSDFHGDKGSTENVSTRSEGMVESWICSSD